MLSSVLPLCSLCSLCPCGEQPLIVIHHRVTESTEEAQRSIKAGTAPGKLPDDDFTIKTVWFSLGDQHIDDLPGRTFTSEINYLLAS